MIILSFAVLISTILLALAALRASRGDALGLPLVAIGSFAYLYVVMPLRLIQSGTIHAFLTDQQIIKAVLLPALMLAAFVWGWQHEPRTATHNRLVDWDGRQLWAFGFVASTVGLVLYVVFLERSGGVLYSFSQPHGQAMAWEDNTAYLYYGPWLMLSGTAMMTLATSRFKITGWRKTAGALCLGTVLCHAILTGSRGPLFSAAGSLFVTFSIARRQSVSMRKAFGVLSTVGVGVLLMVGFRMVLHLGDDKDEAPTVSQALARSSGVSDYDWAHGTTGQEFVFHAAFLDTVDESKKLHYGLNWLYYLGLNPIPKILWPDKHYPESPGATVADIFECTGVAVTRGAAPGIVADLYGEFWLGGVLFLYVFGRSARRLFAVACTLESPLAACAYAMLYAVSLNAFAQSFAALFVPFGYSMAPVVLFTFFDRWVGKPRPLQHRAPAASGCRA